MSVCVRVCARALKRGLTCMIADDCVPRRVSNGFGRLCWEFYSLIYLIFIFLGCWGVEGGWWGLGARSPSVQDTSPYGAAVLSHTESQNQHQDGAEGELQLVQVNYFNPCRAGGGRRGEIGWTS